MFLDVAREASDVVMAQLAVYKAENRPLKSHELREIATVAGVQ